MTTHFAVIHRRPPGRHDGVPAVVSVFRSEDIGKARNAAGTDAERLEAANYGEFTAVPIEAGGDETELSVRWICDAHGLWRIDAVADDLVSSGWPRGVANVQRVSVTVV